MKLKDFLIGALAAVVFIALLFGMVWYGTSAKSWYIGEHDSECEMTQSCGCYKRFMELEGE